ncbi:hypothetical protein PVM12_19325 [Enterobacter soli]|uniref:hypothetical protein n=1 Tax=Enterobacter soli TaxID=885040 RepID=UPI002378F832|nr:hypothetical protein [Enterobacter soli]MDD9246167.1 hypothetical protein [Enterobacter soli]
MAETKIITRTTNVVDFDVSKASYDRAKKKIEDIGKAWEKADKAQQSASRKQLENNKAIIQANNLEAKRLASQNRLNAAKEKERAISAKTATQRKKETADQLRAESKLQRELGKRFAGKRGPRQQLPTAAEMVPTVQGLINAHSPESKANTAKAAAQAMRKAKQEEARLASEAGNAEKRRLDYARKRYLTIRSEAYKIQQIEGLTNAERTEAILKMRRVADQQAKETLNAQETRFELRKITQELQKQARLRRRVANVRTHGGNFGAGRKGGLFGGAALSGEGLEAGLAARIPGPAAAASVAILALAGAANKAVEVIRGSLERQQNYTGLKELGVSATDADAILLAANNKGAGISLDKLQDQFVDYRDKVGDLSLGQWKVNKQGQRNYSGGGELGDVANLIESKKAGAGNAVIKRLQSVDFKGYLSYLRELQKTYKLTDSEMTLFGELIDDGSKTLRAFDQNGQIAADALKTVKDSSLYLTDAQREQIKGLQNDLIGISNASNGLADNFTLGFAEAFSGSDDLKEAFQDLAPVVKNLGETFGGLANDLAKAFKFLAQFVSGSETNSPAAVAQRKARKEDLFSGQHFGSFTDGFKSANGGWFRAGELSDVAKTNEPPIKVPDWLPALAPFKDLAVPPVPTFNASKLGNVSSVQMPQTVIVRQEPVQVNVHVNDGEVKNLVNATVDDRERQSFNMLTQGQ